MDLEVVGIQKILEKLGKDPYLHYTYSDSLKWVQGDVDDYVSINVWFHSVDSYVTKEVWTPTSQNVDVVLTNVNRKPKWKESGEVE